MIVPQRLSRFLSYLLRHRPKEFPLAFDRHGFVELADIVTVVQERYEGVTEADIRNLINEGEKKRFELRGDRVRATYGHSFPVDLGLDPVQAPVSLFYGTARDLAGSILKDGLKPRDRRYVHLSSSLQDAEAIGKRRDPKPAIIVVDASAAQQANISFYASGPLFLAETVPPQFLSLRQP